MIPARRPNSVQPAQPPMGMVSSPNTSVTRTASATTIVATETVTATRLSKRSVGCAATTAPGTADKVNVRKRVPVNKVSCDCGTCSDWRTKNAKKSSNVKKPRLMSPREKSSAPRGPVSRSLLSATFAAPAAAGSPRRCATVIAYVPTNGTSRAAATRCRLCIAAATNNPKALPSDWNALIHDDAKPRRSSATKSGMTA